MSGYVKSGCFIKHVVKGYADFFEIVSWFIPDVSKSFAEICMFGSMFGSVISWMVLSVMANSSECDMVLFISMVGTIIIIPILANPIYNAFGICYCETKCSQR